MKIYNNRQTKIKMTFCRNGSHLITLAEFKQHAAGRFWMQERNAGSAGTATGVFIDQTYTLLFQFGQSLYDIVNTQRNMLDAFTLSFDEF